MKAVTKDFLSRALEKKTGVRPLGFVTFEGEPVCIVSDEDMETLCDLWSAGGIDAPLYWMYMSEGKTTVENRSGELVDIPIYTVADNTDGEFFTECFHCRRTALRYFSKEYTDAENLYRTDRIWMMKNGFVRAVRMEAEE